MGRKKNFVSFMPIWSSYVVMSIDVRSEVNTALDGISFVISLMFQ